MNITRRQEDRHPAECGAGPAAYVVRRDEGRWASVWPEDRPTTQPDARPLYTLEQARRVLCKSEPPIPVRALVYGVQDLGAIAVECIEWAHETFGNQPPSAKAKHLRKEAGELAADPLDGEEIADVFILLCSQANAAGVNLAHEVRRKLDINREREWGEPDEDGVIEHVEVNHAG